MTRAERDQQRVSDVLLKLEGLTWKRQRPRGYVLDHAGIRTPHQPPTALIYRTEEGYVASLLHPLYGLLVGGPFRSLAAAKSYVAAQLECGGKAA
jgi:hypothetical protein